jgi:hypothetical protein
LWLVPGFHFRSLWSRAVGKESGCEDAVYNGMVSEACKGHGEGRAWSELQRGGTRIDHLCQPFDCGWFPVSTSDPFGPGLLGRRVVARMMYIMVWLVKHVRDMEGEEHGVSCSKGEPEFIICASHLIVVGSRFPLLILLVQGGWEGAWLRGCCI